MDDFNLYELLMNEPDVFTTEVRQAHELPDSERAPYFEELTPELTPLSNPWRYESPYFAAY